MSLVLLSEAIENYLTARRARYSSTTVKNEGHVLHRFVAIRGDIEVRHLTAQGPGIVYRAVI